MHWQGAYLKIKLQQAEKALQMSDFLKLFKEMQK